MLTKNQITALTATKAKTAFATNHQIVAFGPNITVVICTDNYTDPTSLKLNLKALTQGLVISEGEGPTPYEIPDFAKPQYEIPPLHSVDCCSTDVTRLALNGIYTDGKGYCATDGHRLVTSEASVEQGWILPAEFVKLAHKLKAHCYNMNESEAGFLFDGGFVIARLIEGPYPRYQNVLPSNFEHSTAIPEAKVWDEAAKKLKALGSRTLGVDSNGFALGEERRHIKVMEPWHNEAWSNLMAFNAKYMAQLLKGVTNPTLQCNGPLGACVVKTEGEIRLIMPLRIMD